MKRFRDFGPAALLLSVFALALLFGQLDHATAQQVTGTNYQNFDGAFAAPALSGVGTTTLTYSGGTVYVSGLGHAITAGTFGSLAASQSDCSFGYASCEIVYWTTSTGLTHSTSINTANNGGQNAIVGYLTTDSMSNILTITPATLNPTHGVVPAFSCGSSTTCASPTTIAAFHDVRGTAAMSASQTVTISGVSPGFTSATSYSCTASNANAHGYTVGTEILSSNSFVIVSGTSNSDTWIWGCRGN